MIFGVGEKSISKENTIFENYTDAASIDYLLFFDSRGLTINEPNFEKSHLYLLMNHLKNTGKSFLAISRPKNLTIFATLYNFLKLNENIKFKYLLTNLGFVDCTPKKEENIKDVQLQISQFWKDEEKIIDHENYKLSSGNYESLKSIKYSSEYIVELSNFLNVRFEKIYFINTPLITNDIKLKRKRPQSFFAQLIKTNELIDKIITLNPNKNILIDIKDLAFTFDGVHCTKNGHQKKLNKIKVGIET